MSKSLSKSRPTWRDVKSKLANFDHAGLMSLVGDLYDAHKENQTFLHARLGLIEDALKPYQERIDRWLWPEVLQNQDTSVAKAKQAISDYEKAVGDSAGLAELMVFYCERATGFCREFGNDDETYIAALVRMFEKAVGVAVTLPDESQDALLARLEQVRITSENLGYGIADEMDSILAEYTYRGAGGYSPP